MSDISKINIENTTYNLKDETARTSIANLKNTVSQLSEDLVNNLPIKQRDIKTA